MELAGQTVISAVITAMRCILLISIVIQQLLSIYLLCFHCYLLRRVLFLSDQISVFRFYRSSCFVPFSCICFLCYRCEDFFNSGVFCLKKCDEHLIDASITVVCRPTLCCKRLRINLAVWSSYSVLKYIILLHVRL